MHSKNEIVFYSSKAVKDFLLKFGKGPDTKDYEFFAALLLKNFCEKQWDKNCEIGFELKPKILNKIPKSASISLEQIADIFRKGIDEASLTDCIIATEQLADGGKREGMRFQLKRFGIGRQKKDTNELIEFINSLNNVKSEECLFVTLDKGVEVELPRVRESILSNNKFPFSRLMFGWMENGKICIGEIYTQNGMEEYNLDNLVD
ncbi:hypothetical protein HZA39_03900 [Candidatus Peregrinibacteria bacterium]|nr:hypothetical protein [Candidatus Peregrinibacteria bacterium]